MWCHEPRHTHPPPAPAGEAGLKAVTAHSGPERLGAAHGLGWLRAAVTRGFCGCPLPPSPHGSRWACGSASLSPCMVVGAGTALLSPCLACTGLGPLRSLSVQHVRGWCHSTIYPRDTYRASGAPLSTCTAHTGLVQQRSTLYPRGTHGAGMAALCSLPVQHVQG